MEPDDGSRLAVGPIGLDHLPSKGEPAPSVGLDENASLVAVAVRFHHQDIFYGFGLPDLGHRQSVQAPGVMTVGGGWCMASGGSR
jgi:hypothetical protein